MDLKLTGKSALVTGASSGIGAGIARVLADEGVQLVMTATNRERLETVADEIVAAGHEKPALVTADITDPQAVNSLAEEAQGILEGIDILVNAAGSSRPTDTQADDAFWEEAFELNFSSARRLTQALLPAMRKRQWGRIVNISGTMEPRSLNAASAAKAALHVWAKGLSCDVAAEGVTVNCVAPGRINSAQIRDRLHPTEESRQEFIARNIPAGTFGEPEDMAYMTAFLASPLAWYITGAVIPVDGGMHYFAH
ncbi:MAG: SDR family NAD(P)-dependent oxidoreductase [Pseudomonadota bacterium]|uniref:SDR family NAD(P)-dependent oxidoreductase n=1 Tax=Fodinicurvata fenggangensis TaxID=1121830 RepID=UPI00047D5F0D|nr:SDR family oxidoreductase [Fodinicurvata fenggangensis]